MVSCTESGFIYKKKKKKKHEPCFILTALSTVEEFNMKLISKVVYIYTQYIVHLENMGLNTVNHILQRFTESRI